MILLDLCSGIRTTAPSIWSRGNSARRYSGTANRSEPPPLPPCKLRSVTFLYCQTSKISPWTFFFFLRPLDGLLFDRPLHKFQSKFKFYELLQSINESEPGICT